MHTEHFIQRLDKTRQTKSGFDYNLGKALESDDFTIIEKDLNITIPARIKDFYLVANGLITKNPDFELKEINSWIVDSGLIHFATFDNSNKVYFKIAELNSANEWTILNTKDNYEGSVN